MVSKERVLKAVLNAVDEVNQQLTEEERLEKSPETGLLENLDSLSIVNLIVSVEQKIQNEFNTKVALTQLFSDIEVLNQSFKTVGTLVNYMELLLNDKTK